MNEYPQVIARFGGDLSKNTADVYYSGNEYTTYRNYEKYGVNDFSYIETTGQLDFGTGNFTIDGVYFSISGSPPYGYNLDKTFGCFVSSSTNVLNFYGSSATYPSFIVNVSGSDILQTSNVYADASFVPSGWHHLALVKENNIYRVYCDGNEIGSGESPVGFSDITKFRLYSAEGGYALFDWFRVSNVARWSTSGFDYNLINKNDDNTVLYVKDLAKNIHSYSMFGQDTSDPFESFSQNNITYDNNTERFIRTSSGINGSVYVPSYFENSSNNFSIFVEANGDDGTGISCEKLTVDFNIAIEETGNYVFSNVEGKLRLFYFSDENSFYCSGVCVDGGSHRYMYKYDYDFPIGQFVSVAMTKESTDLSVYASGVKLNKTTILPVSGEIFSSLVDSDFTIFSADSGAYNNFKDYRNTRGGFYLSNYRFLAGKALYSDDYNVPTTMPGILGYNSFNGFSYGVDTNAQIRSGYNFSNVLTYAKFNSIYGGQYDDHPTYDRVYGTYQNANGTYRLKFYADSGHLYQIAEYDSASSSGEMITINGSGVGDGLSLTFSYSF